MVLVLAIFSYPPIWQTFQLAPAYASPQLIVIYTCLILLARNMTLQAAPTLLIHILAASLFGTCLALAVEFLTFAACGGSTDPGLTKAAVLLSLSSPVAFCLTVRRFQSPQLRFPMLFATLVFALSGRWSVAPAAAVCQYVFTATADLASSQQPACSLVAALLLRSHSTGGLADLHPPLTHLPLPPTRTGPAVCGGYRQLGTPVLWKYPLYISMYFALAGAIALLASMFVMPTPAGKRPACQRPACQRPACQRPAAAPASALRAEAQLQ